MKPQYEVVFNVTNMDSLSRGFRVSSLINPTPKHYRKYVLLEVASPQQPNPVLHCACCLYSLGFGYDRIARYLGLKKKKSKEKVAGWIQRRVKHKLLFKPPLRPRIKKPSYIPVVKTPKDHTQLELRKLIRSRFWLWFNGRQNYSLITDYVGSSRQFLRHWLESQFTRSMSWSNYPDFWTIDHTLPLASFDLTNPQHLARALHFSNLKPMRAKANLSKAASIVPCQPELTLSH